MAPTSHTAANAPGQQALTPSRGGNRSNTRIRSQGNTQRTVLRTQQDKLLEDKRLRSFLADKDGPFYLSPNGKSTSTNEHKGDKQKAAEGVKEGRKEKNKDAKISGERS